MENTQEQVNEDDNNLNQNTPIVNPISNQRGNFLLIIGVIVIILVIGVGAYYPGTRKSSSVVPSPNSVINFQTPQSSPASSPSEKTANWKTYTDAKYRLSFQYSPMLIIKEFSPGKPNLGYADFVIKEHPFLIADKTVFLTTEEYETEAKKMGAIGANTGIYLQIFKGQKAQTIEKFANQYIDDLVKLNENPETKSRLAQTKNYNGINLLNIKVTTAQSGGEAESNYYFYMNENLSIAVDPFGLDQYVDTIISTFKFTQ